MFARRGFVLIEVIVVTVAFLGILTAISIPQTHICTLKARLSGAPASLEPAPRPPRSLSSTPGGGRQAG
jgi:prepilin-type N-terminal cleavage/methylation domain-containing protein